MTEEKVLAILLALRARELNPTDRLVLALIVESASDMWLSHLSTATLAAELGVTRRTAQQIIARLVELGYIRRIGLPYERPRFVVEIGKLIPREDDADAGNDANRNTGMVGMHVLKG